jgi:hypothetical protein
MSRLYLVGSARQPAGPRSPAWTPPPFDLWLQPQRPGELCREIVLDRATDLDELPGRAADAGVPAPLWATLVIEGERCIGQNASLFKVSREFVVSALDDAAAATHAEARPGTTSRLMDYARALLDASQVAAVATVGGVLLRPSLRMLTAWSLASEAAGLALETWTRECLVESLCEPVAWEASAALAGQTLAEWTVVQTARRLRPASTLAHSTG